ncbi:vexin isoform X1 [Falco biarmicus]|uniref:vexin isoform X1 n=1 Tax=Falco biarmicus TaxID=345155 RepID=UPI0024BC5A86|nr:vexin isoform X1 [Falco biarmicus]
MHQIYSCSDENLEVFTTVISSKWPLCNLTGILEAYVTSSCPSPLHADRVPVLLFTACSPARRRAKNTQHILTKSVVAVADHRPHRTEKLQPHQDDLLQVLYREDEVQGLGCLQSQQRGPCPAKGAAQHVGITEQESSKSCNHLLDGKSLVPPSPVAHITVKAVTVTDSLTSDSTSTENHRQHWRKTAEYDLNLPLGAEASLPLTGGNLCGTPSLLRKMWMKHKKKSEYLGATNSAFEAD